MSLKLLKAGILWGTLAAAVAGAVLVLVLVLVLSRPFPEPAWAGASPHPASIYQGTGPAGQPVVTPFRLQIQPMQALLLVNFEGDPDAIYRGLEPQQFDDDVHGTGLLVIGWRLDGRVDVFHDPELRLDPALYSIAGEGLHQMVPRDFRQARFELGESGAQVELEFEDLEGRRVRLSVRETDPRPRRPFPLLAPMGAEASDPPALPLVYVKDFYFVRRAGSEIRIEFDGRSHESDAIPLILDGTRMHFIRYSMRPFIVFWNPDHDGPASILADAAPEARGVRYELTSNGPFREIRQMSRRDGDQSVTVEFEPAIPHLLALRDGADVSGAFRITTEPAAGTVTGRWRVVRQGGHLHLEATPQGGWVPGEAPRMARLLFRGVSTFRSWPTTYAWTARIDLPGPGAEEQEMSRPPSMESGWVRIDRLPGPAPLVPNERHLVQEKVEGP